MPSHRTSAAAIKALFLDVGGVLLTNGWDHVMRRRAAEAFGLDFAELDERHGLIFDTYETGKLSLDPYLDRVVFNEERPFSRDEFKQFMFDQSKPYPDMIDLVRALGDRYHLTVAVISNEGRELAVHRTRKFALSEFARMFIYSSFVHLRKPDEDIYRAALDIAQVPAQRAVYIEDRAMFADVARELGIRSIHHTGYQTTRSALQEMGLEPL
jgi:putative hydrolase of the HAD superfamily